MAVDVWEEVTVDGVEMYEIQMSRLRVPKYWVPGSQVFLAVASPTGNANLPAILQGDKGDPPDLEPEVDLTVLPYDDATPASSIWQETSPGVYKEIRVIHAGQPGDDGVMVLNLEDYGTPVAGHVLVLNADASALEWQAPKWFGDKYYPATLNSTPSGNVAYTLGAISIGPQPGPWRPTIEAQTLITGTGTGDQRTDLVARLQIAPDTTGETAGNIIGRGLGVAGKGPMPVVLHSGPAAGMPADYDLVPAGVPAIIYLRAERQTGADTFTTSASTTLFAVKVDPVP